VARVVSETDLQRIDKHATFATHAMVQPAELLARLVNILGYIPPPLDDDEAIAEGTEKVGVNGGVQGFSEKEILASEASPWSPVSYFPSVLYTAFCFLAIPVARKLPAKLRKRGAGSSISYLGFLV
jgi:hypothetical protein